MLMIMVSNLYHKLLTTYFKLVKIRIISTHNFFFILGMPGETEFDKDTISWISNHSTMQGTHIACWVHSHVEGAECGFSSIDLHTQFAYSRLYPDLLGLVYEIDTNGILKKSDFYGLTRQGNLKLRDCKQAGTVFHDECWKKSFYTSKKHLISFFDGQLNVYDCISESTAERELNISTFMSIEDYHARNSIQQIDTESHYGLLDIAENNQSNQILPETETVSTENEKQDELIQFKKPLVEYKTCKGCMKTFLVESFFMHFRRGKNCREKYGKEYAKMKLERSKEVKRKINTKYSAKNKERLNANHKKYDQKNKTIIYEKARQRKIAKKIANLEFDKRFKIFKNETKNGPSFACNCCHRKLFLRGNFLLLNKILINL